MYNNSSAMSSHLHNHSSHNMCPLNEFCSAEARTECRDILLKSCKHCNISILHGLSVIYFVLGIAIFLGNFIIITVYSYKFYKRAAKLKSDPVRLSLAIADIITSKFHSCIVFIIWFPHTIKYYLWQLSYAEYIGLLC